MIQGITATNLDAFIQTEDNRINTTVASTQIRHLMKFTNDMDKSIVYAYPRLEIIYDRYTLLEYLYSATPDPFGGQINFLPAGYWKYEAYEVSWIGTVTILDGFAPTTEDDVLSPAANNKGVVQGLVTKGKMYIAEKGGTEQVQYTQRQEPTGTNYIYYGQ
tara:strand:+ start:1835 stop:2317 length:483 start_codon:yes stop_codon:yes gene_type:complete